MQTLNKQKIVPIAIGVFIGVFISLAIFGSLIYLFYKQSSLQDQINNNMATTQQIVSYINTQSQKAK